MACSDNVIRAGLTPKLKDVKTLIEILSFDCEPSSNKKIEPFREDEFTEIFRPPVLEFAVAKIIVSFNILSLNINQNNYNNFFSSYGY